MSAKIVGMVIQGKKLSPKDANGLSDPYLELGLINNKGDWVFAEGTKEKKPLKSKVVRKTLSPVWRQPFDFVIPRTACSLKIQVWDWDYIGASEFMGEVILPLADMVPGKEVESWLPLKNRPSKPKEEVSGDIFVRYTYLTGAESKKEYSPEEQSALDDIKSGDIDSIIQALISNPNSATIQSSGLTALFKWGATSQPTERVKYLNKSYQSVGNIFDLLLRSANKFSSVPVIQFYGLGSFTFFSKLVEAKELMKEEYLKAIVKSIVDPPQLSDEDKCLHISNCFITLANLCTFKFDKHYSDAVKRCQLMVESAGAISEALNCLKKYEKHELLQKCVLTLLVKCCRSNDEIRNKFIELGVVQDILKVIKRTKNVQIKWIAVDVIDTFIRSDNKVYAESVLANTGIVKQLNQFDSSNEGSHAASLSTVITYCFEALAPYLTEQHKTEIAEERTLIGSFTSSFHLYKKYIPTEDQKPLLGERILRLLGFLSTHAGCRQEILKRIDDIVYVIKHNAANHEAVQKMASWLLETLLEYNESVPVLKQSEIGKTLEGIERKDPSSSKYFSKITSKLK